MYSQDNRDMRDERRTHPVILFLDQYCYARTVSLPLPYVNGS